MSCPQSELEKGNDTDSDSALT